MSLYTPSAYANPGFSWTTYLPLDTLGHCLHISLPADTCAMVAKWYKKATTSTTTLCFGCLRWINGSLSSGMSLSRCAFSYCLMGLQILYRSGSQLVNELGRSRDEDISHNDAAREVSQVLPFMNDHGPWLIPKKDHQRTVHPRSQGV